MSGVTEFLVAKDPELDRTGDMMMFSLVYSLAQQLGPVRYIALSREAGVRGGNTLVKKSPPSPMRLVAGALAHGRSLVHERFDLPALRAAITASDADRVVADHTYLAEPFFRSGVQKKLYINTVVSESLVWGAARGSLGRLQSGMILRDELRAVREAVAVATYDADEADDFARRGARRTRWLDVTLPPVPPRERDLAAPRVAFVGDRRWPPNEEGARLLLQWWPAISAGVPGAELLVIGHGDRPLPVVAGVRELGFVEDLDATLATCRGILASIATGGGVRVKILDAVARGMPVIGTPAAVGSLDSLFDLPVETSKEGFIDQARRLLLDADRARRLGEDVYEQNVEHWRQERPLRAVQDWLAP